MICGFAGRRRGEAGVVGEAAGVAIERADVDDVRADGALAHRQVPAVSSPIASRAVSSGVSDHCPQWP